MIIYENNPVFLQRTQESLNNGYLYYIQGEVEVEKAKPFLEKFRRLYQTDMPSYTRSRIKAKNTAVYKFYCVPILRDRKKIIRWILLKSPGIEELQDKENWLDINKVPLIIGNFEATRMQNDKGSHWSWKVTDKYHTYLKNRIKETLNKHSTNEVMKLIDFIQGLPGFSGIRKQVNELKRFIKSLWPRLYPGTALPPNYISYTPYLRKLPDKKIKPSSLFSKDIHNPD